MIQCSQCYKTLSTRNGWIMHCQAKKDHKFCTECNILFSDRKSLHSHKTSRAHKIPDIPCTMCSKKFKAPSEIAAHIESGGCNPNINRHHVSAAIHAMNISPPITIARRIEGPANPVVHFSATNMAFNGKAYECYICHDMFATLRSLNLHLNSPVHDAEEFKCPKRRCGKKFKVISSLIQHIESESCGIARFTAVRMEAMLLTGRFAQLILG
ncbi:hypothetical protein DFS33DRAFT_1265898 [Desarmillaria ectypa]|nr:hypothetical protein DFS33DRAFT_1265898 [Desarmillaria ectypa]